MTVATTVILSVFKIIPYYERLVVFIIPFIILFAAKAFDIKNTEAIKLCSFNKKFANLLQSSNRDEINGVKICTYDLIL